MQQKKQHEGGKMKKLKKKMTDPNFISKVSLVIASVNLIIALLLILLKSR